MNPACLYCAGSCGCDGICNDVIKFCCDACKRDYEAVKAMYPASDDPVEEYWGPFKPVQNGVRGRVRR